ncbi:MAG TPA: imidazolonepropionase [Acidobacteriaceae bacterium]|nr:imidazolonepropionase [Acidobacteriaceae bacterium]
MGHSLALVNCSQLLTLAGPDRPRVGPEMRELGIFCDGALLVEDGKITATGSRSQIEALLDSDAQVIDAGGRVVAPGFVDAHTHLVFAGNRADEFELRCTGVTYQEIASQGGGILSTVRRTRAASESELVAIAEKHASWFLRNGTTTIEAKSGYGLSVDAEMKILRVVQQTEKMTPLRCVPTFLGAHEVPEEFRGRTHEYVELVIGEMLPQVVAQKLARFCDVFCEPHIFDVDGATRILEAARTLGLGLRVHADQFSCSGGASLAARLGASSADHLEHTDSASIAALAKAGVQPVLLPGSVYSIGSKHYASARAMMDAGLAVVLATDFNPGSSPIASMPVVLSLACTQMKMTPAEGMTAATINAAWSLGLGREVGSLEPGKVADLVVHEANDYREIPYFLGTQRPAMVFAEGERLV